MTALQTFVFFLLYDPRDALNPFRVVGGPDIGAPWMLDLCFATQEAARDQLLAWFDLHPRCEFHDLTK